MLRHVPATWGFAIHHPWSALRNFHLWGDENLQLVPGDLSITSALAMKGESHLQDFLGIVFFRFQSWWWWWWWCSYCSSCRGLCFGSCCRSFRFFMYMLSVQPGVVVVGFCAQFFLELFSENMLWWFNFFKTYILGGGFKDCVNLLRKILYLL